MCVCTAAVFSAAGIIKKGEIEMKSFPIDRTKILSIAIATVLSVTLLTGCFKKKAVVTSLATLETTTITTAESTTEEPTEPETSEPETTTTTALTETTKATTAETTKKKKSIKKTTKKTTNKNNKTTGKVKTTAYKATVYARVKLNVRTGPGTNYKIAKTLNKGDAIDVRGKTSNGWYKTINGNYVKAGLTTTKKPATTE